MTQTPHRRRLVLLGSSGQLGRELGTALTAEYAVITPARRDADFTEPMQLGAMIGDLRPDVIVNAAAYTQVDEAESEPDLAATVNAQAVVALSTAARRANAMLVHYSTDYVFDGSGTLPWTEDDLPAPVNTYGRTKFAGEQAITASGCAHIILRVSWLYGRHGKNFLKTMLNLACQRSELRVVADQVGSPTSAALVAQVTTSLIPVALSDGARQGIYHLAASGYVSWCDYAALIVETARDAGLPVTAETVVPVTTAEYPTLAPRPRNSRLDTSRLRNSFGLSLPDWRQEVVDLVHQLAKT